MRSLCYASVALLILMATSILVFRPPAVGTVASQGTPSLTRANQAPAAAQASRLAQAHLPLYFEANQGQTDARVKFLSRGTGYTLFLTEDGATLSLRNLQADDAAHAAATDRAQRGPRGLQPGGISHSRRPEPPRYSTDSVQLKLVAANPSPAVTGDSPQSGRVNYFVGNDPSHWHSGITTYKGVRYANVYPGVDMVFHGSQHELEYDFALAPGADPSHIALQVKGARGLHVDPRGNAIITTPLGDVALHKPITYQGEGAARTEIASNFELRADGSLGFHVGDYDRSQKLIIDPVLTYSTYLGGSTNLGYVAGLVTNSSGNVFVAGQTNSPDFPVTLGAFQPSLPNDTQSATVTEFTPDGSSLVFSTFLGGTKNVNFVGDLDIDSDGNVYVMGETRASDFPLFHAYQSKHKWLYDVFLTVFNPDGGSIRYSTYLGGKLNDDAGGIRTGNPGKVYLSGTTFSTNFPTTANAFKTKLNSAENNCFIAKFDTNQSGSASLLYSTYLGGSKAGDQDDCNRIARDSKGDVFVAGSTESSDFPTTSGAYQTHLKGTANAFVTELNTTGSALVHSTLLGGTGSDSGVDVRLDGSGNIYVTGQADSSDFPTTNGAFQRSLRGESDAFVTKFKPTLNALVYSTYLGGSSDDGGNAIFVDSSNNAYVAGITTSTDFPLVNPIEVQYQGGDFFSSNGFALY